MTEKNWHDRHSYIERTGKRISKGAWERLNRAYDVHHVRRAYKPTGKLDENGQEIIFVQNSYTHVLMPETTKANRKVRLSDRFHSDSKRARYNNSGTKVGETR